MFKKPFITGLAAVSIFISAASCYAGTFTAFDSRTFIRGTGQPFTETASFNIKNPNTSYTLHIYNGGIGSERSRVSSAVIKLNGSTIFDTNDFNQQIAHLQKQVSVADTNLLEVELRSIPDSGLAVLLEGVDNDPPIINIISPQGGSTVKTPKPDISLEYSDALSGIDLSTVGLTVDGLDVTVEAAITETGINYTPPVPLKDAIHTITASVSDKAGNSSEASASFMVKARQRPFVFPEPGFNAGGYYDRYNDCSTGSIKVGDINRDGILDVAAVNYLFSYSSGNKSRVSVMLGKGDGSFEKPISFAEQSGSNYTADIALGNFNNDNYPDMAVSRYSPNKVEIFIGNGDGTFRNGESYSISSASWWSYPKIFTGHFDSDSYEDIIISGPSGGIYFLHGNGDGTFSTPIEQQIIVAPYVAVIDAVASDFNKDGINDLAITVQEWDSSVSTVINKVLLLLNNGNGTFLFSELVETDGRQYQVGMAAEDFNRDGNTDILVTTSGQGDYPFGLTILMGDGNGGFSRRLVHNINLDLNYLPKVKDLNGDKIADIVILGYFKAYVFIGRGDGNFENPMDFNISGGGFKIGDFDGDGAEDLVSAGHNHVFILFARGDGTFIDRKEISVSQDTSTWSTLSADFDGDNRPDLAMTGRNGLLFSTILNNGNAWNQGTFQGNNEYRVGDGPVGVKIKDLNGDGLADVVTANELSNNVTVMLNRGEGSFFEQAAYQVGEKPGFIAIEDLNGDGNSDIITANYSSDDISVLLGIGDGTFQSHKTYAVGSNPNDPTVGDFNADGKQDIAVANSGPYSKTVSILFGNGDGTFKPESTHTLGGRPSSIVKGDFNEDGLLDLAISYSSSYSPKSIALLLSKGDGTLISKSADIENPYQMNCTHYDFLSTGDINKDGKTDLITANTACAVALLGDGNGVFRRSQFISFQYISHLIHRDIDNDGESDIVFFNQINHSLYGGLLDTWFGKGDGTFEQGASIGGWKDVRSLDAGDINGDGITDIALVDYKGLYVISGSGDGIFPGEAISHGEKFWDQAMSLATADFNGDNNQDIVVSISLSDNNRIEVYLGTGYNTFTQGTTMETTETMGLGNKIDTGDFNGDGLPDIAFSARPWETKTITIYLNKGNGTFGESISYNIKDMRTYPEFADINNDGYLDIVSRDAEITNGWYTSHSISIHTGNGDGTFQYYTSISLLNNPVNEIVIKDFNGDKFLDIAATWSNNVTIFLNRGNGTFGQHDQYQYEVGRWASYIISQDFNSDGILDLAIGNSPDTFAILVGNGDGTFSHTFDYSDGRNYWNSVSEDFNMDGRPDIANPGYDNIQLLFNLLPPLLTPPSSPKKLTGKGGDGAVALQWSANTESDLAGYNIYRSLSAGGGYVKLNSTTVSSPTYNDATANNGTTYYYTVSAVDKDGDESSYAFKVKATPNPPDIVPPIIKITTPTSDKAIISPTLFVSGTINETDAKIAVNGITGTIQKNDNTFTAYGIPLSVGENTIITTAVDAAGNSSTDSIKVIYVPTASISGVVKDELTGQPVQWASVYVTDSEKTQSLSTGSDGSYFFGKLIPGDVTITANANNYDTVTMNKTFSSGEAMNFDILMPLYPATLRGTVYNASTNRGIAGATVTVTDRKKSQTVTTDNWGSYEVTNITPYDTTVTISKEGYETYAENRNFSNWYAYWGYFYLKALPPSAPTGLSATSGGGYITLTWNQSLEDLDGYNIYRSTTSASGYIKLNSSPVNFLSYKDLNVSTGTTYYYVITSVNTSQMESGYSTEASATSRSVISPTGLTATAGAGYLSLVWSQSSDSDISYYNIYRSTTSGSGYVLLTMNTTATYKDTAVTAETSYFYVVTAVNTSLKESGYSNEVSAIPEQVIITAPTGLKATSGTGYVQLTWNKNPESDISYYNVYRKALSDKGYIKIMATGATSYTDNSVAGGITYYYVITAVNTSGIESGYSTEASATPEKIVITAPTGLTATAGGGYIELSWNRNPERDISSYNIYRRTVSERGYTKLASTSKTSYTDTSVTADTTYYYAVTALNTSRTESGYSTEASATPTGSASSITVISPTDGATLTASATTITGMVITSKEIGLAIDVTGQSGTTRYMAQVNKGYFAAMIDLQEGANTIKVTVTDTSGNTEEKSITINATATTQAIKITANPESGIPAAKADGTTSLEITLTADTSVSNTITYSWDIDGDGRADQEGVGLTEITASYQTPGLYFPTLTVTDSQRNTYTATTIVNVLSKDEMDTLLKGKWEGMKGALTDGDTTTAVTYILDSQGSKYKEIFDVLKDQLQTIFSQAEDLVFVFLSDNRAEYENIVIEDGTAYSYPVIFVRDENGLWKVRQF